MITELCYILSTIEVAADMSSFSAWTGIRKVKGDAAEGSADIPVDVLYWDDGEDPPDCRRIGGELSWIEFVCMEP